jgi:hypothetical protein
MTSIRKLIFSVLAVASAAFALPASAATKSITLTLDPAPTTATTQYHVAINNTGNSNSNSFEIDWANSPSFVVTSCVAGGDTVTPGTALTGAGYKGCQFIQQLPNKSSVTVTLNVTVTAACGAASLAFNGFAWTGAPGPASTSFPLMDGPYSTTLPQLASGTCKLGFITQPTSATINTAITGTAYNTPPGSAVAVGVFNGAVLDTSVNGSAVTLDIKPGTGTSGAVLAGRTSTFSGGVATFAPSINTIGQNYVLTASAAGYTSVDSNPFWITAAAGTVNCTDSNYASSDGVTDPNKTYVDFLASDPGNWGLRRGPNLQDLTGSGGTCKKVGVSLTVNVTLDGSSVANFVYDKSIPNQQGNFKYWIVWPETTPNPDATDETSYGTDGAGTAARSTARYGEKRPLIAWVLDGSNNPVYVPVLNCASDDLTQGSALMPYIPNVEPFISLGVMYSQYAPSNQAKACIAAHVMVSSGLDGFGNFQVIYADKIVDQVDTFVRQP